MDLLIDRGAFLAHFQQSWTSHFASAKSAEYGSAADHPFDWSILLKNWDLTVPALVGVAVLAVEVKTSRTAWLPLTWLALVLLVFTTHRPWWAYFPSTPASRCRPSSRCFPSNGFGPAT